jgi:glutaredoxin 3
MVFAKSYCPHCKATKALFSHIQESIPIEVRILDLDQLPHESDGQEIQSELWQRTGQRTVPNIFIGQKHMGGNSDVQAMEAHRTLRPMLEEIVSIRMDDIRDVL